MVHKKLTSCQKRVLKHLKGDSQTWRGLSEKAKEEYKSDIVLIKKIKSG